MEIIRTDGGSGKKVRASFVRPDDWHVHLRDDERLYAVLMDTADAFERAIVMPNTSPPIFTTAQGISYYDRINTLLPKNSTFKPLMTLYLTDNTTPAEIRLAKQSGIVVAAKMYPAGATTGSDQGVTDIKKAYPALEEMQRCDLPLLVHGEVTDPAVDIFDREAVFIERVLEPLLRDMPGLTVVFEHATTRDAVQFVTDSPTKIAATITAQHLLYDRNAMLVGGIRPHYYCLPILKRNVHRDALIAAATSGNARFFLGTDSAPHLKYLKENACGCAGCYTARAAIELYLGVFEQFGTLDKFEGFASLHGADFYGLERNTTMVAYEMEEGVSWQLPESIPCGDSGLIVPFPQKTDLCWRKVT